MTSHDFLFCKLSMKIITMNSYTFCRDKFCRFVSGTSIRVVIMVIPAMLCFPSFLTVSYVAHSVSTCFSRCFYGSLRCFFSFLAVFLLFPILDFATITHEIHQSFDNRFEVRGIFLDISKTFDQIWHKGLIFELK